MSKKHERIHVDETVLCKLCLSELGEIYADLELTSDELDLLDMPRRSFTVHFPARMDSGKTKMFVGHRVQYNDARGPSKGGIRFHPDLTIDHVKDLSFLMVLKCSVANIPFGGSKGGVVVNPKELSRNELEQVTRGYIRAIADYIGPFKDIPAPDVYTDEKIMVWILDEYERIKGMHVPAVVTGKPLELAGSRARSYSTSLGGIYVLEEALKKAGLSELPKGVAVQGFGNVGENAARILHEKGYKVIAVSDSKGGILSRAGLNIPGLMAHKAKTGSVADFPGAANITNEELLACDCDILVPAALADQLNEENARDVRAKIVLELANAPTTIGADEIFFEKKIMLIPDVLANAGGVVVSYFEWSQNLNSEYWEEDKVVRRLKNVMISAFNDVYGLCHEEKCRMRRAAYQIGVKRVLQAERLRGNL
ncbi:MAG: Glu/Leu/Phe/Val dehydrogenase [Nitrospiraceae bacterium]|nr:Glu/Leu/Phe/Val dehydrogenase [Nitrospiraceae bacterium]